MKRKFEQSCYQALKGLIYSILALNDFEFVKVTQKKITVLKMGEGAQYI